MTTAPTPSPDPASRRTGRTQPGPGLRARLWASCLILSLAGAVGVLWVAATRAPAEALYDPSALGAGPWAAAVACLVLGLVFAIWLDRGIVGRLRALVTAVRTGDPTTLRGAAHGWGEIGLLGEDVEEAAQREQELQRKLGELDDLRHRLRALRAALEGEGPITEPLSTIVGGGPVAAIAERLEARFSAERSARDSQREAARATAESLSAAIDAAQHSAESAERGFVEVTALMTGLRELERLTVELTAQSLARASQEAAPAATPASREQAMAAALEELVRGSGESVDHLAAGLFRVQEIVDQVQRLANRATVIALTVVVEGGVAGPMADDLRALSREVRAATDRTLELSRELDGEVRSAVGRMHELRGRVAARLDEIADVAPVPAGDEHSDRLLQRMRDVLRDVSARTERVAAAGERASRAAGRVAQHLDEHAREAARLEAGANGGGAPDAAPAEETA